MSTVMQKSASTEARTSDVQGEFIEFGGERGYVIRNVDQMPPFFISVISSDDHWLFVSSNGGLTAGRVSPEYALFPYVTVDKIHESGHHTGPKTLIRALDGNQSALWEPFNAEHFDRFDTTRNIYKSLLGNRLCLEEENHDLGLTFRYTWAFSAEHGFVRHCELVNNTAQKRQIEMLDGVRNVLPAGTPRFTQTNSSNLVDAYKWTELDKASGLALFTLYSGIVDRAEPAESLKATTMYCLGKHHSATLISDLQLKAFRRGQSVSVETHKRGIRGAFFTHAKFELGANASDEWRLVFNAEQGQRDVVALKQQLKDRDSLAQAIDKATKKDSDALARIMGSADAFQATAEENVAAHHYANVLFNVLRGGIFDDQYSISARDFSRTIRHFNRPVYERHADFFKSLPDTLSFKSLAGKVEARGDNQLSRLTLEYLPITFGRRHGDPSRPWNQFAIQLKDDEGNRLLSYQGNWRDIFQNWEALALSFPGFVESMIAKFVNASTADGYNPYRITKEGIDWEIEEPDDPWSYIGYWGDHQIIYLQKLLELSRQFDPDHLRSLLHEERFCYANVPYRIKPLAELLADPKNTVLYDEDLEKRIEHGLATLGADAKLLLDGDGNVYQVNLFEKLLVPLLAKIGNLVVDGGIWLNTQRPEWNDANNALVGYGLSMVTLYYMRRYVRFLASLLNGGPDAYAVSTEVHDWLLTTASALESLAKELDGGSVSKAARLKTLETLGQASSDYREVVYKAGFSGKVEVDTKTVSAMLENAQTAIDHSIRNNRRDDGLYHTYNLLDLQDDGLDVDTLYPMLEGQVAILSSGALKPAQSIEVLEALFDSDLYRDDQASFMLYPDRKLPGFLTRNRIDEALLGHAPKLKQSAEAGESRIVVKDLEGNWRFNSDFANAEDLKRALQEAPADVQAERQAILDIYETVFDHKSFTGRSGTMFGFEGLGSIYWHMVSKLLLAVMETFFDAVESGADANEIQRLGQLYYKVRAGIGFNKTPEVYGAFPTDPYSHTPRHAGARQPGMTGQVKEEIVTRFAELGLRVRDGAVTIHPRLLRRAEFLADARDFRYLDVDNNWQTIELPPNSLGFTWCQVPVVFKLGDEESIALDLDGKTEELGSLELTTETARHLFNRDGQIRQITVTFPENLLFNDKQS